MWGGVLGGTCRYCGKASVNRLTPIYVILGLEGLLRDERAGFLRPSWLAFWLRWFINWGVLWLVLVAAKWLELLPVAATLALVPVGGGGGGGALWLACFERVNVQANRANLLRLVITDGPSRGSEEEKKVFRRESTNKPLKDFLGGGDYFWHISSFHSGPNTFQWSPSMRGRRGMLRALLA